MKEKLVFILRCLILPLILFTVSSCNKESLSDYDKSISNEKIFDDKSIVFPIGITAGNNCLLSIYFTNEFQYKFMLTDNSGKLLWTKKFAVSGITKVIAENDNSFSIIISNRRINISSHDGSIISDDPDFFSPLFSGGGSASFVQLNNAGNYLLFGSYNGFAFAGEMTHSKTVVFMNYDSIPGSNFRRCIQLPDDSYILLGKYKFSIGLQKMSSTGVYQSYDTLGTPRSATLNDFIAREDGNFSCFLTPPNGLDDQTSTAYTINPSFEFIDSVKINYAEYNVFAGDSSSSYFYSSPGGNGRAYAIGNGVIKRDGGDYFALMQSTFWYPSNGTIGFGIYNFYNRTFHADIGPDLTINNVSYFQNNYSDSYTAVCKTSDGKIAVFGMIDSFGNGYKPILIITK